MSPRKRLVITGGPGAGKSSLVDALAAQGWRVFAEAGRATMLLQEAVDGPAHPSRDPAAYAEAMLLWDMRSFQESLAATTHCIFDRGIPDTIGYLRLIGRPVPQHMLRAAKRMPYDDPVVVAPPWRAIYRNDAERSQDFAEAEATHAAVTAAWRELGYRLVDLPLADIAERCKFIADIAGDAG